MGVPHVMSFCCCFGLEVGAKIVAWLHLLVSLSLMVVCSVYANKLGALAGTAEDVGDSVYGTWYGPAVTISVVSAGHVLLAATLLYGVCKRNTLALRTWVYVMWTLLLFAVLFNIIGSFIWGVNGSGSDIFLAFLLGILFFGFVLYCIMTVYSFYLMVRSSQEMEGPTTNY